MIRTQMSQIGQAGQVSPAGWAAPAGTVGTVGQVATTGQAPGGAITGIRRAGPADLAALSDFFAGLSLRTRFLRFFAPVTPTPAVLRRLAGGTGSTDAVVALRGGVIIGHAMAVDRPGSRGEPVTEIGVVVADAWQSQGVGSALTRTLISRAQARGVTSLTMDVMHGNHQVLAMIASHWVSAHTGRGADCVTIQVRLPLRQQERSHATPSTGAPATTCRGSRHPARPAAALTGKPPPSLPAETGEDVAQAGHRRGSAIAGFVRAAAG